MQKIHCCDSELLLLPTPLEFSPTAGAQQCSHLSVPSWSPVLLLQCLVLQPRQDTGQGAPQPGELPTPIHHGAGSLLGSASHPFSLWDQLWACSTGGCTVALSDQLLRAIFPPCHPYRTILPMMLVCTAFVFYNVRHLQISMTDLYILSYVCILSKC